MRSPQSVAHLELYNLITVLKPGLLSTEAEFRKVFVTPGKPKSPRDPERLRALLGEVMVRNTRSAADVRLPHRIAASVVVPPSPAEAGSRGRSTIWPSAYWRPRSATRPPSGWTKLCSSGTSRYRS